MSRRCNGSGDCDNCRNLRCREWIECDICYERIDDDTYIATNDGDYHKECFLEMYEAAL